MFSSCIDWFNGDYFLSFFLFLVDWASFSFVRSSVLSFIQFFFFILPDFCCHRRRRRCCLSKGSPQQKEGRENESFTRPFCLAAFCFVLFRFSSKNETKTRQKIFFLPFSMYRNRHIKMAATKKGRNYKNERRRSPQRVIQTKKNPVSCPAEKKRIKSLLLRKKKKAGHLICKKNSSIIKRVKKLDWTKEGKKIRL